MQILLRGGDAGLACLERWERRDFSPGAEGGPRPGDHRDAHEREIASEAPGPPQDDGPHRRVARAILDYEVFPPELIAGVLRRAPVEIGDTVGARYRLAAGIELFFASRVVDRFDGAAGGVHRTGFTYRTLAGHPELGEESFSVEKDLASGRVRAALRAWSRPGTLLARLGAPLVRHLQLDASRRALDHLARVAAGQR